MEGKGGAAPNLRRVLAENLRRLRKAKGLTQDNLAEDARYLGVNWSQTSVADLEAQRRALSAEELILLPGLLGVELVDLLHHPSSKIQVGEREIKSKDVRKLVSGQASEVRLPRIVRGGPATLRPTKYLHDRLEQEAEILVRREAESHAIKVLGQDPNEVLEACFRLWNLPLTEERERRLQEGGAQGNLASRRGRVTRQLIEELRNYFEGGKR